MQNAKAIATTLSAHLESVGIKIKRAQALDVIAKIGGTKEWRVMAAKLQAKSADEDNSLESQYIRSKGVKCPHCGSNNIHDGDIEHDGDSCTLGMHCDDCGGEWEEIYTLTGMELGEAGNEPSCENTASDFAGHPTVTSGSHVFYKTSDADAPEAIKDRNGDVVLQQCLICEKAEGELDGVDVSVCHPNN